MRKSWIKTTSSMQICLISIAFLLGSVISVWADDITGQLNVFSPGTTISADQVNKNFDLLGRALPRLKAVVGTNISVSNSPQNLTAITVTPQFDGTLILIANASVTIEQGQMVGGQSWGYSACNVCITETSNGNSGCDSVVLDTMYVANVENYAPRIHLPFTAFRMVPVSQNTPLTYYLTAYYEPGSVGACTIQGSGLTALFFPGGYMQ
jgi:hypothetical protein